MFGNVSYVTIEHILLVVSYSSGCIPISVYQCNMQAAITAHSCLIMDCFAIDILYRCISRLLLSSSSHIMFVYRSSRVPACVVLLPLAVVHAHHPHRVRRWTLHKEIDCGIVQQAVRSLVQIHRRVSDHCRILLGVSLLYAHHLVHSLI